MVVTLTTAPDSYLRLDPTPTTHPTSEPPASVKVPEDGSLRSRGSSTDRRVLATQIAVLQLTRAVYDPSCVVTRCL